MTVYYLKYDGAQYTFRGDAQRLLRYDGDAEILQPSTSVPYCVIRIPTPDHFDDVTIRRQFFALDESTLPPTLLHNALPKDHLAHLFLPKTYINQFGDIVGADGKVIFEGPPKTLKPVSIQ